MCVDDADMEISHVIRGEDHLSNTPKHILLFRAMGADVPQFAHLPLILNPDRTKMSKRKSQTAVADYRAQGYIPEGVRQLPGAARLVERHGGGDLLAGRAGGQRFELERVHQGGAVFDRSGSSGSTASGSAGCPTRSWSSALLPFLVADLRALEAPGSRCGSRPRRIVRPLCP